MKLKTIITASLLLFVLASLAGIVVRNGCASAGQQPDPLAAPAEEKAAAAAPEHQVIATYFHNTVRCPSCLKIERFSHEALEATFAEEIKDGLLVYRMVNVDDEENKHFIEDYGLYTKHLVLSDRVKGKEVRWKDLPAVWDLLGDEKKFKEYVSANVRLYLDGADDPDDAEATGKG